MGLECCFPLIAVLDAYVVVSRSEIELGEHLGPTQFVDEFRDEGYWVLVLYRPFVQVAIVLTGAERTVFLADKEERGGHW